jgi:4-hydroxybenzoate polyprenyltransferase
MIKIVKFIADSFFLLRPTLMIPVWTILMLGWITGKENTVFSTATGGSPQFWIIFSIYTSLVAYIYIFNQINDIEGDRKNGKLFILPEGHLPIWYARVLGLIFLAIGVIASYLYSSLVMVGISLLAGILGFLYNFKPFSLKDRPIGGLWANWLGHGVLTYFAGWYAANYNATINELGYGLLFSLSAGFANGAVYLTSTIPDLDGDIEVGKRTFAVVYGNKKTALWAAILVTLSLAFAFLIPHQNWIMIITAFASTVLFWLYYKNFSAENSFTTFRWPVLFLSAVTTLYIPIYAVLVFGVVIISKVYYKKRFNLNYPSFKSEQ